MQFEIDGADPIFVLLLVGGPEGADFEPGFEVVVGVRAFFVMDYLGQFAKQQAQGAADVNNVHRHIEPVEHEDAGA